MNPELGEMSSHAVDLLKENKTVWVFKGDNNFYCNWK